MKSIDISEFRTEKRNCPLGSKIDTLSDSDKEKLAAALAEPTIQTVEISRWLEKRGVSSPSGAVGRHRRKECGCR